MSVFEVLLVRIQSECERIRTRVTPNTHISHVVQIPHSRSIIELLRSWKCNLFLVKITISEDILVKSRVFLRNINILTFKTAETFLICVKPSVKLIRCHLGRVFDSSSSLILNNGIKLLMDFFFYNNVVHKIQTIFTTNKIKRNNYNKTWDYTNTIPITTRGSLGPNTK